MTAFVLGNGLSRQSVSVDRLLELGRVYGCNGLYRTHTVTALVATDHPIARSIQESGYSQTNRFYTRRPLPRLGAQMVPKKYFGYSSGPIATAIAAEDANPTLYLLGFDMAPDPNGKFNNVYAGTQFYKPMGSQPTFTGNWTRQLAQVMNDYAKTHFVRIIGETTQEDIRDFKKVRNLSNLPIASFLERINTGKDL